ncbi:MAG: methyltransferase domain-containing protein [Candidatus Omnitrophica bacterium]|nr:methyltransferase domain-containing protein [Candidatus Omnitrophota bacterium]
MGFLDFLKLPEARTGFDIDSQDALEFHVKIIKSKPLLSKIYSDFYCELKRFLPDGAEKVVEIGSGGGFIKEIINGVVTSDIRKCDGIDMNFSADHIPFEDDSIDAFLILNVFHHLSSPAVCLREMSRCLRKGGRIIMIEPANTALRRYIDGLSHTEPFDVHGR